MLALAVINANKPNLQHSSVSEGGHSFFFPQQNPKLAQFWKSLTSHGPICLTPLRKLYVVNLLSAMSLANMIVCH